MTRPIDPKNETPHPQNAVVDAAGTGLRLDQWLAGTVPGVSRSRFAALIDAGAVRVNDAAAKPSQRLAAGDRVDWQLPAPRSLGIAPEDLRVAVLWQDEHLALVNKPAGMNVHPDTHHASGTLVHALLFAFEGELSGIGGVERPGIVHRLDKGTSGVLVVAKTDAAHAGLAALFRRHDIERRYWALVRGRLREQGGTRALTLDAPIARHKGDRVRMTSRSGHGRAALTWAEEIEAFAPPFDAVSLVQCRLGTGRTHQVRTHLADAGHALLGDDVYAPRRGLAWAKSKELRALLESIHRPMLHAVFLGFVHPVTGARVAVECPPPEDFARVLQQLRAPRG